MLTLKILNLLISILFTLCYFYQYVYVFVAFFKKPKPHLKPTLHNYAVLISARNEESVIGHLIDSIWNQTYPTDKITVFVVADNCDENDNTAEIARNKGCVVFERHNQRRIGKGYALNYILHRISKEFKDMNFDAFFVFDADNVLDKNYISEMNKAFSDGYKLCTSYRNSKNYGDNWISAGYALWFLREAKYLNYPRMLINSSCAVSGTGFMFSREIIEKCCGWNFFLLTEDIEFTAYNIANGEKIGYAPKAMLYDEQPTTFRQSWNQRLRWSKGFLQVFRKYGGRLFAGIFKKRSFSCYDLSMTIAPAFILSSAVAIVDCGAIIYSLFTQDWELALESLRLIGAGIVGVCGLLFILGTITVITEWKLIHASAFRKIFHIFTFPLFMLTYFPIGIAAIFAKVSWKHIDHNCSVSIDEFENNTENNIKN